MALGPTPLLNAEGTLRRAFIVLLYSIPILQAIGPVLDPDIWWHIRVGQWIFSHGQVPETDSFSAYGLGKPWIAYSWLFEILVYFLFARLGLLGIVLLTVSMSLLITLVLHFLLRRTALPFAAEMFLVAVGLGAMSSLISPRPWLFSILFFTIELTILFYARRTQRIAPLLVLPPLFVLWANLHIQFVYGLCVMALFLIEVCLSHIPSLSLYPQHRSNIRVSQLSLVFFACLVATLITPYHFQLYTPIFEYIGDTGVFQVVMELLPLSFRSLTDWLVIGLAIAAAFVLGWHRTWLPFPTLLLLMGTFLAFRARRDIWVLVLAALAIISEFGSFLRKGPSFSFSTLRIICVIVTVTVGMYLVAQRRQILEHRLETVVEQRYPVAAVKFINENNYPGPIYNHFNWGGYLIWSLPRLLVSMDGRTNLHGDQRILRSVNTWSGVKGWESDPELMQARLVIGGVNHALTNLMRTDPRFKLVYEDDVAVVFVAAANRVEAIEADM